MVFVPNVKVPGASRLYRAAPVDRKGRGDNEQTINRSQNFAGTVVDVVAVYCL
jgi:hypothetical protein